MASEGVSFLLEKVNGLLKHYIDLIGNAEDELLGLKSDLDTLKSFLADAAGKPNKGEVFRRAERKMREVIYQVEDTLDTCLTASAAKAKKNPIRRLALPSYSLAKEVKSLRESKVKEIIQIAYGELGKMLIGGGSGSTGEDSGTTVTENRTIRRDKVIGLKDEEDKIIGYLTDEKTELDVTSIIGMPGLGKTTLAWKIFDSDNIKHEFRIRIWVNISQKFNRRDFFLDILKKFTRSRKLSGLNDHELEQRVRKCLANDKFLIVLDDVWSVDHWDAIKNVFPMENGAGKVMITSREKDVGTRASVRGGHPLRFLTTDESWQLLQLEVFNGVGGCPEDLEIVGKRIAHDCDGLPLTVVVIGGILQSQYTSRRSTGLVRKEWIKVSENVSSYLKGEKVSSVVALSYERLPDGLKECFVYMGVFPEDHEISSWTLTRLWIAEGFVERHREGQTLEESADEKLNALVDRNLLMIGETNPTGQIKTCRVHDLIRTFCTTKALEQSLFQEVKKSSNGVFEPPVTAMEDYHRLCFHSDDLSGFFSKKLKGPRVRSFLRFSSEPVNLQKEHVSTISDAFGLLRVLDSVSIRFHQFPPKLDKLIHLRYITLYVRDLKVVPKSLSQLWNLQSFVLDTNSTSITMKANIWRLIHLRHLKTKAAIKLNKDWGDVAGENLQTLGTLSHHSCTDNVSRNTCKIKKLGIRGNLQTLFRTDFLAKLDHLEKLKLVNDTYIGSSSNSIDDDDDDDDGDDDDKLSNNIHLIPRSSCLPGKMKSLSLTKTFLSWSDVSTILSKIDTLEVLKLKENACAGKTWEATAGNKGFCSLHFLLIADVELVDWTASSDQFPSLTCLSIKNCKELRQIPLELAEKLENLEIDNLCRSATDSALKIKKLKEEEEQQKRKVGQHEQQVRRRAEFHLSIGLVCDEYGPVPVDEVTSQSGAGN
ncbi:hypothetical protein ABFS82_04G178100 [Erythranthe guttata]